MNLDQTTKSQVSHTPGPWEWDEPGNWHGISARVSKSDPYGMIAQVQISGWKPRSMAIANAKLIAASPELLAACEKMVAAFKHIPTEAVQDFDEVYSAWKEMKAAILKAKGGA